MIVVNDQYNIPLEKERSYGDWARPFAIFCDLCMYRHGMDSREDIPRGWLVGDLIGGHEVQKHACCRACAAEITANNQKGHYWRSEPSPQQLAFQRMEERAQLLYEERKWPCPRREILGELASRFLMDHGWRRVGAFDVSELAFLIEDQDPDLEGLPAMWHHGMLDNVLDIEPEELTILS